MKTKKLALWNACCETFIAFYDYRVCKAIEKTSCIVRLLIHVYTYCPLGFTFIDNDTYCKND